MFFSVKITCEAQVGGQCSYLRGMTCMPVTGLKDRVPINIQRLLLGKKELSSWSTAEAEGLGEGAQLRVSLKPQSDEAHLVGSFCFNSPSLNRVHYLDIACV